VASKKIQQIALDLHETLNIEVKNWLNGLTDRLDQAKLAREIIALANHGGGYVFIGFSDDDGHPELAPVDGEESAFSQDSVSGVVERFIEPSCQVKVETVCLPGSSIHHPVLVVPGSHRTPLWAKRGAADEDVLKSATVYIRRTGAKSEPPRSQDDWEKLIDRFVKARQSEIISAMRNVLNPDLASDPNDSEELNLWIKESQTRRQAYLEPLHAEDQRRFLKGYWSASFKIDDFHVDSIASLNSFVRDEMPRFSGWRPFIYVHENGRRPISMGNIIEAWLGHAEQEPVSEYFASMSDFWRLSTAGFGHILRPFFEDESGYCQNRYPGPVRPSFDRVYHAYRVAEILKVVEALGSRFAASESKFTLRLTYHGMLGRSLESHDFNWIHGHDGTSNVDTIDSEIEGSIELVSVNFEEMIVTLLDEVYGYFDFGKTNRHVVSDVAKRFLEA